MGNGQSKSYGRKSEAKRGAPRALVGGFMMFEVPGSGGGHER